jgi:DNA-3-methyladenine glycosylase II
MVVIPSILVFDAHLRIRMPSSSSTSGTERKCIIVTPDPPKNLDLQTLARGVEHLSRLDTALAGVVRKHGPPPLWARDPGYSTLIQIILEQQVSLASAKAAYAKLCLIANPLNPEIFLELDDRALKEAGFSRQKMIYCRGLSIAVLDGRLQLDELDKLDDDAVREELVKNKGIGPWSADIYLLEALLRPDIWPVGDLALASSIKEVKGLSRRPGEAELLEIGNPWKPWRAVAARILWHSYLSERGITM